MGEYPWGMNEENTRNIFQEIFSNSIMNMVLLLHHRRANKKLSLSLSTIEMKKKVNFNNSLRVYLKMNKIKNIFNI